MKIEKTMITQRAAVAVAALGVMVLVAQAKTRRPDLEPDARPLSASKMVASKVSPTVRMAASEIKDQPVITVVPRATPATPGGFPGVPAIEARETPTTPAAIRMPAAAQTTASTQPPARAGADFLEISNADRISVRIQGQPELSGDYRINDDQTISIPVVGRVSVSRLDAAGLEKALSERLSRIMGREAYVTVEVTEYRPVFISGYVSKPGTAPWKPGMTVLQAVTVSGGTFRGGDSSGVDGSNTKLQRTIEDQKRVLATIARLSAEQKGAEKIELPTRLIALVGRREAQDLIDAQKTSFESRRNSTESQAAGLQRAIALAKQEIESIKAQRSRLTDQLKFRRVQFAQLKQLYDKQFLRIDRLTEEELKIADLEEKLASLGVSLSRTDGLLLGYERDLGNLKQDRRALIDTDLMKLERDAAQLEVEIEAAGTLPRKITRPLSDADADAPKKDVVIYEIVRQETGGPRTVTADRNTLVKPGDMVVVSLQ
jgi:protein involved in polysaccharide export with SLBB domain